MLLEPSPPMFPIPIVIAGCCLVGLLAGCSASHQGPDLASASEQEIAERGGQSTGGVPSSENGGGTAPSVPAGAIGPDGQPCAATVGEVCFGLPFPTVGDGDSGGPECIWDLTPPTCAVVDFDFIRVYRIATNDDWIPVERVEDGQCDDGPGWSLTREGKAVLCPVTCEHADNRPGTVTIDQACYLGIE